MRGGRGSTRVSANSLPPTHPSNGERESTPPVVGTASRETPSPPWTCIRRAATIVVEFKVHIRQNHLSSRRILLD